MNVRAQIEDRVTASPGQIAAITRNIISAITAAVPFLIYLGLSPDSVSAVQSAVQTMGDGLAMVAAGIAALVPIVMAAWAGYAASRKGRLSMLNADPQIKKVETVQGTPAKEIASEIPGNKIT
jgi:hypothetical protein